MSERYVGRRFWVVDALQQVLVASAAQWHEEEYKFALEAADIASKIATNIVNAVVQTLRPTSPDPFVRVEVIDAISARIDTAHIVPCYRRLRQASTRAR